MATQQQPDETPAMDNVESNADEYVGEPLPDGEHDLDADSFANRDPEDVALDSEKEQRRG
jgi:hypothetical protein